MSVFSGIAYTAEYEEVKSDRCLDVDALNLKFTLNLMIFYQFLFLNVSHLFSALLTVYSLCVCFCISGVF